MTFPAAWQRCALGWSVWSTTLHDDGDEVVIIRCADGSTRRVDVTGLNLQQSVEIILETLNGEVA